MNYLTIKNYKKLEDVLNSMNGYVTIYEHENVYNIYVTVKVLTDNFETKNGKIKIEIHRESNIHNQYTLVIDSTVREKYVKDIHLFNDMNNMRDWIAGVIRLLINTNRILYV